MKITPKLDILYALALAALPLMASGEIFFSDSFSGASTINQAPGTPTTTATSYQTICGLTGPDNPFSLGPNHLTLTFTNTSAVLGEVLARFASTPKALITPGDYVEVKVVFVCSNILTGTLNNNASLNIGLFNSSGVQPNQGHIVTSSTAGLTGGTEDWLGYIGRIFYGQNASILARSAQAPTDPTRSQCQDLLFSGASSSQAFNAPNGATVGSATTSTGTHLTNGMTYTVNMVASLIDASNIGVSNAIFAGTDMTAPPIFAQARTATGSTLVTAGFDGFAIGWRNSAATAQWSAIDINSIEISGQATAISGPPDITMNPSNVVVSSGAGCAFFVTASGYSMTYQWKRYGTNLTNSGNISGANSDMLVISPAGAADVASGANGYSVTVTGAGNYSTNSATASLSLGSAKNLVWNGPGTDWDLNNSANWLAGATPSTFNFGDSVTFDTGSPAGINLTGRYLSASKVTVAGNYAFSGSGSIAGPGSLIIQNSFFDLNNVNTHTGGTFISNAVDTTVADVYLRNLRGLGNGPIHLASSGGLMEVIPPGDAATGINGDIVVDEDFTIRFSGTGSYAGVFNGSILGGSGKTLTLDAVNQTNSIRYRVYGANTVCGANLVLNGLAVTPAAYGGTVLAPYHSSGNQFFNGVISGNGGLIQRGNGLTILSGASTYSGGTLPTTGIIGFGINTAGGLASGPIGTGPLYLATEGTSATGSGQVLAYGGARTIANPIQYPSGTNNLTLMVGGTNDLTLSGDVALNGIDGATTYVNRFFDVTNTGLTTMSGTISGSGFGITKLGTGILALTGTETYTGPTLVSNGTLRVNGSLNASSAVTVATNATLGGTGTINGSVTVVAFGTLSPGASIGTLSIGGNLSFAGREILIEVDKSAGQTSDRVNVTGTPANTGTGTLTVTNIGGTAFAQGDVFTIFNKAVTGGASLIITNFAGTFYWSNNLAVNGTIMVGSPLVSIPAAPTANAATGITGSGFTANWSSSAGATGYRLDVSTSASFASFVAGYQDLNVGNVTSASVTGLAGGTTYYYRVRASNSAGTSGNSGTITVATIPTAPTDLTYSVSGTSLTISWPLSYVGWSLQSNSVAVDNSATWFTVPGSASVNSMQLPVSTTGNVFYRLNYLIP